MSPASTASNMSYDELPAYPSDEHIVPEKQKRGFSLNLASTWSLDPTPRKATVKSKPTSPSSAYPLDPATRTSRVARQADSSVDPATRTARSTRSAALELDPATRTPRSHTTSAAADRRAPIRTAYDINPASRPARDAATGSPRQPAVASAWALDPSGRSRRSAAGGGVVPRSDGFTYVVSNAQPPAYEAPPTYEGERKASGFKRVLKALRA